MKKILCCSMALFHLYSMAESSPATVQDLKDAMASMFNITDVAIVIDFDDAQNQEARFPGDVSMANAFLKALESFLNDDSDIESPLSIARSLCESGELCSFLDIKNKLKDVINEPVSRIVLLNENDFYGITNVHPPERGERISENWLFLLSLPRLSDHLFWAIIPRDQRLASYNYGFN